MDIVTQELKELFLQDLQGEFVFYHPNEKQRLFHSFGTSVRQRLFLGGNRTGKTYAACMEIAMHLTGYYPAWWNGYRYNRPITAVCASVTAQMTRDNLQKKYFEWDRENDTPPILHQDLIVSTINQAPGDIDKAIIRHVSGQTSELRFMAYQQRASAFQGWKADFIHLDEMPDYDVYQEAMVRTTSFGAEQTFIVVTSWPEKGMTDTLAHFWNNAAEEEVKNDRVYVRIAWDDANHMTAAKKKALGDSIPDYIRAAREHGLPVFGHGKVFNMDEKEITVEPFVVPRHWAYVYGLDPSSTSGGTWGMVLLAYDRDHDIVYVVKDYEQTKLTPVEHGHNISQIIPVWCTGMVDPAGAGENMHTKEKTIDFLRNRSGLHLVKANKANGTKDAIIDEIYMRIRSGKFKIMYAAQTRDEDNTIIPEKGCTKLMLEWRQYYRDDKGLIIKRNDHTIDALFYALNGIQYGRNERQGIMDYGRQDDDDEDDIFYGKVGLM